MEYRNLILGRPDISPHQGKLLVVPHYDTVANSTGPDGKASGVAALIETAIMPTDTANFSNPHYPRPSDTLKTLNPDFAALVGQAMPGMLWELAKRCSLHSQRGLQSLPAVNLQPPDFPSPLSFLSHHEGDRTCP